MSNAAYHPQTLPAEWATQDGIMLTWPHADSDWATTLNQAEAVYLDIAEQVCHYEQLLIICHDAAHQDHITEQLKKRKILTTPIHFYIAPSNDSWSRDHGPITVNTESGLRILDFQFNGWGGKYPAQQDNAITQKMARQNAFGSTPIHTLDWILEGGAIETDGCGTLLTTTRCLLAPTRNPHFSRDDYTNHLQQLFGIERILWLEHGALTGDDTDSHIDTLARFCDPQTIAYVSCTDPNDEHYDEHYDELQRMQAELASFRTLNGNPYRLIPLPLPSPKYNEQGERLPATYANFLIINGAVLVPTYDDPQDQTVLDRLAQAFPGRKIIPVASTPLIQQFGSLHCITMQLPAGCIS